MTESITKLHWHKKKTLLAAVVWAVAMPALIGITNAAPPQNPAAQGKWEAISVKPCQADLPFGARGGGDLPPFSPGRLNLVCQTASGLIQGAYINGREAGAVSHTSIEGPSWINSERYTVEAKAEGTPDLNIMRGPMLQTILEDRFRLKVHWNPKEVPVYELTIAKGGAKLKPFKEGSCIPPVFPFDKQSVAPGQRICGGTPEPAPIGMARVHYEGRTIEDFVGTYLNGPFAGLERQVIDKTGLAGKFDIELEHARRLNPQQQSTAAETADPAGPSIFTALQEQLGLKLEAAKGTGYSLIVDSIERPTEN